MREQDPCAILRAEEAHIPIFLSSFSGTSTPFYFEIVSFAYWLHRWVLFTLSFSTTVVLLLVLRNFIPDRLSRQSFCCHLFLFSSLLFPFPSSRRLCLLSASSHSAALFPNAAAPGDPCSSLARFCCGYTSKRHTRRACFAVFLVMFCSVLGSFGLFLGDLGAVSRLLTFFFAFSLGPFRLDSAWFALLASANACLAHCSFD